MALFTTVTDGNINDGATFGNTSPGTAGVDYPASGGADTVEVASGHILTINTAYSIQVVSVTGTSGDSGEVNVQAGWTLLGNCTLNAYANFRVGAGVTVDMNGNNILFEKVSSRFYEFITEGTSGNRCTITGGGGSIIEGAGSSGIITKITVAYTDFSGIAAFFFRPVVASATMSILNSTFDDCGVLESDQFSTSGAHTIQFCKFTNPRDLYIIEMNSAMSGTPSDPRKVADCVFSITSGNHRLRGRFAGWTIENNVFRNVLPDIISTGTTGGTIFQNNFHAMEFAPTGGRVMAATPIDLQSNDNFFYMGYDDPAFCTMSSAMTWEDCVFDVEYPGGSTDGGDLFFASSARTDTYTIQRNIFTFHGDRSDGTPMQSLDASISGGNYDFNHNTVIGNGGVSYGMLATNEASGVWNGTLTLYSNIAYTWSGSNSGTVFANADTLAKTDFNNFFQVDDHYDANTSVSGKTEGDPDFGGSDTTNDPRFLKVDANLANFDTRVGGAGTASNAIDEFVKLLDSDYNSSYNITDLLSYMRTCLTPKNTALSGAGDGGSDQGAVTVSSTARLTSGFKAPSTIRFLADTAPTVTGTKDFTIAGIGTPDAVIIECMSYTGTETFGIGLSRGVSDGINEAVSTWSEQDNSNPSSSMRLFNTTKVINMYDRTATLQLEGIVDSFIDDGVRINFTNVNSAYRMQIWFILGAEEVLAGDSTSSATLGGTDTVSTGFELDTLFVQGGFNASGASITDIRDSFGIGMNKSPIEQRCYLGFANDNASPTESETHIHDNLIFEHGTSINGGSAELTSIGATDFVLTTRDFAVAEQYAYLAVKWITIINQEMQTVSSPNSTGTWSYTGASFQPDVVVLSLTIDPNINGTVLDAGVSTAKFNSNEEMSMSYYSEDNISPSNVSQSNRTASIYLQSNGSATPGTLYEGTLTSFTANGWNMNMTSAVAANDKFLGALFQFEDTARKKDFAPYFIKHLLEGRQV